MDKRDEILRLQTELIKEMTERNMRSMADDLWGRKNPDIPPEEKKPEKDPAGNHPAENEDTVPPENIEDLRKELDGYIGLDSVKKEVDNLINMITVHKMREEHGLPTVDMSLHMVFTGNPGTGKTMMARLMSRIYHSLGILSKGHLIEVDRSGLVAGYVGQTALKTAEVIKKALGGVLFIDEAYALSNHEGSDFGQEAIETVLKAMEDNRGDLVVIVAGYTELMGDFINSNPGLESRFNRYLEFPDYTLDEMVRIFKSQCDKGCYTLGEEAEKKVVEYIDRENTDSDSFGNARGVRNCFEKILVCQANRLAKEETVTRDSLMEITAEDVENAMKEEE